LKPRNSEYPAYRKPHKGVKGTRLNEMLKILRLRGDIKVSLRQRWWSETNYMGQNAAGKIEDFFNMYF
jgi:hypothetical protein